MMTMRTPELESEEEEEEEVGGDGEEDAEREEEEAQEEDEEDEGEESDNETPATGSRASTPDVSKMTKRQRSRLDQVMGGDFLNCHGCVLQSFHPWHLKRSCRNTNMLRLSSFTDTLPSTYRTANQETPHSRRDAMRRAEMARRRKNLSEKRNEEEKVYVLSCSQHMKITSAISSPPSAVSYITTLITLPQPCSQPNKNYSPPIDGHNQQTPKNKLPKRRGKISATETAAGGDVTPIPKTQQSRSRNRMRFMFVGSAIGREQGGCAGGVVG
jgi:hypothetical protein